MHAILITKNFDSEIKWIFIWKSVDPSQLLSCEDLLLSLRRCMDQLSNYWWYSVMNILQFYETSIAIYIYIVFTLENVSCMISKDGRSFHTQLLIQTRFTEKDMIYTKYALLLLKSQWTGAFSAIWICIQRNM
jgi:hypothetical protein